uniref:Large ribosomal subunit protein uL13c n=1 Tax=Rhodochaete parvula TaxID=110510 RepID=A0A1X9PUX5_9RHOD|nr:50S ribosomal protein L13 [Rhodochaete parvula]ASK39606.1 ribosomal protein L13 [Rhodochaete parvula]
MNKTIFPKVQKEFNNNTWYLINADGKNLGRLATTIACYLRGKNKTIYTPHGNIGDYVIVINADKISVTGKKLNQKKYYRHSGKPGGMKVETLSQLKMRIPTRIVEKAVKGMLPKGPLGRLLFKKLKVYAGIEHPHLAQAPIDINLKEDN